ncbi:GNAT family N-acetyltransferase [Pseudomonas sp. GX19020]|uniref:GNAT family N-acetyltransferase n=1 Tax=Pseudomonas sp. GX19020 TaxID=2942277 RepID=UPI00201A1E41|nr:GNAT family N-acetyltransferase [Pseudomonas sp. GX19020]MCL4066838.1 GNAT family N-acetyltransferase [Pseudomonas sp. GX19020]
MSTEQMVMIRPALRADVPAIFRIRLAVRENALSEAELAALGITRETVAELVEAPGTAWVAQEAGKILGFSMIDREEGCLFAAFVAPEAEGRGIGRALTSAAEAALFADHAEIWLETAAGSRAEGFYRRLGWGGDTPVGDGDLRLTKQRG